MRLLLVEDNERLSSLVAAGLGKAGFSIDRASCAADGSAALRGMRYDVVVLDLGLPDADGLSLLTDLRQGGDATPVIVLTARDGVGDRVKGLNLGADDYLLKPFAMEELVARIRVLLRRPGGNLGLTLTQGNVTFDTMAREVHVAGQLLLPGRRELDALEVLMRRAGRVVSKAALEDALYAFGDEVESNTIEVLIHRLRKRMQVAGADVSIQTLRGVGYFLAEKTS
ncbi:response regulator transcription factor [Telmatospirillum siberiense]|uniref:DNA-binding response regulator n=1 Tax=Telmatospirillum siberiense TaxID=382514 RepID=A0A2N3Q1F4_9PROT|nr:response regulator transcription factor [Telmatospirillum siberiense]PKU26473.1 DNA-binding response regulator [Telmatospirillum siberiense]